MAQTGLHSGPRVEPAAPGVGPWRVAVLAVVALTGLTATVTAWYQAKNDAQDRQQALAGEMAGLVRGTAHSSVTAVAGAGGLVSPRGVVDLAAFVTYAREVVDLSPLDSLAYLPVVARENREVFEALLGGPITELSDGELVPAADHPLYYPVLAVEPRTNAIPPALGFDTLSDPVRGRAATKARDTGRTVLTAPVRVPGTDAISFYVVKPLYRTGGPLDTQAERREAHLGFVTTPYSGADFARAMRRELPSGSRFSLRDGDVLLAVSEQPPSNGVVHRIDAEGRTWVLAVEDGRPVDGLLVWSLAAFTALLVGGLLIFFRRAEAHDRATRRSAGVIARTADVAQALAAAGSVEEVEEVVSRQLPAVLGASGAGLGIVHHDLGVLRMAPSEPLGVELSERYAELSLEATDPLAGVVRTGEVRMLRTPTEWRMHAPEEVVAAATRAGIVSAVFLPLGDRHGQVASALFVLWDRRVDFDAPILDTIRTLAELCESTLDRARSTDEAGRRATQLADLAARLAAAVTVDEVLRILCRSGSTPVDASATSIGIIDRDAGVLRTHHGPSVTEDVRHHHTDPPLDAALAFTEAARTGQPVLLEDHAALGRRFPESARSTALLGSGARAALPIRGSDGQVMGSMVHAWAGPRRFHEVLVSTLLTIAELAGQAFERAGLSEAEHRLVTTLQDSLLVPLPEAPCLDIATCYLPAAHHIGMGGDWYEGIALDEGRYALIIGDVAGHGITAVGDMARLRTVIGALVRLGTPLGDVFPQTTALLQAADHAPTASALLVVIDIAAGTATYVAAGHPPPFVRSPSGGTLALDGGRQPILGIEVDGPTTSKVPFPPGSVLVAYTDGLIERRGEAIDVSMERLRGLVDTTRGTGARELADRLLSANLEGHEPDDDVALVVIGRRLAGREG